MFTFGKKIVLFFVFLILACSIACQQNTRLSEPLETNYAPFTQLSLPEGAKARIGKGWISGIEYSVDGKRFAVTSSIGRWLYDAETLEELALFTNNKDSVWSGRLSPDRTRVATGVYKGPVHLWNAATGEFLQTLKGHTLWVSAMSFSPDGTILATGGHDGHLRLWSTATGELLKRPTRYTKHVTCIRFSPDGKSLATGTESENSQTHGRLYLWDVP